MEEEAAPKRKKIEEESINLKVISNFEKIELSVIEMKSTIKELTEHFSNRRNQIKK